MGRFRMLRRVGLSGGREHRSRRKAREYVWWGVCTHSTRGVFEDRCVTEMKERVDVEDGVPGVTSVGKKLYDIIFSR